VSQDLDSDVCITTALGLRAQVWRFLARHIIRHTYQRGAMSEQKTLDLDDITVTKSPLLAEEFVICDSDPTDSCVVICDSDPSDPCI
jgi:hypothetical protein